MPSDSIDAIIDAFPHPSLTAIEGVPTFASIRHMQVELNANAASIQTNLGDGQLGLLFLTVTQAVYDTLTDTPFDVPENPGPVPRVPNAANSRQAADIRATHAENKREFNQYVATDKALKQQIIQAVGDLYLRSLKHRITGYANVTTREILDHLYQAYGTLTPQDLQHVDNQMKKQYDPYTPIENLFDQIEEAVDIASAANAPYAPKQVVNIAYNIIFHTEVFHPACRDWRKRPDAQKTWGNFKIHFTEAHIDFRSVQYQNPYASANSATPETHEDTAHSLPEETASALANLATATAADRAAVAALTTTNEHLTKQLTDITEQLTRALEKIATLETSLSSVRCYPTPTHQPSTPSTMRNYCWTHGFRVGKNHTSMTCRTPKEGHQRGATAGNMMGGSTVGINSAK